MLDFLTYDAKVAVLILAFYICYRLLLSKETFHRVNREDYEARDAAINTISF